MHSAERRTHLVLVALTLFLFAAVRVPYVSVPLERDEGEYAYIAQRWLAGDVPYRDAFDQKPPAIFLVYAAALATLGESIESIHLALYAWTAATTLLLYGLVRRLAGALAGIFAALVFALATSDPRILSTTANTESFMLLPLVGAAWCLWRGREREGAGWWAAGGALALGACAFKQVALVQVAFLAGFSLAGRSGAAGAWRTGVRRAGLLALGASAAALPILLYFARRAALGDFLDAVFLHNLAYAVRLPPAKGLARLAGDLPHMAPTLALPSVLAGIGLLLPHGLRARARVLLGGWLAASVVGACLGFHFRPHYFVQCLPPLAALAGVALAAAARAARGRSPAAGRAAVAGLVLVAAVPPLAANRDYLTASPEAISRRIYGLNPFPESVEIGEHIRARSEPGDTIYVIGSEPQIFFYAQRASATRYIFFYPLTGPYDDALARQREAMREVEARRPVYVVRVALPTSLLLTQETEGYIFAASRALLARDYRLELLARPRPDGEGYEFLRGRPAALLLAQTEARGVSRLWITVYRRIGRTGKLRDAGAAAASASVHGEEGTP